MACVRAGRPVACGDSGLCEPPLWNVRFAAGVGFGDLHGVHECEVGGF
jgi:hypothetical protein